MKPPQDRGRGKRKPMPGRLPPRRSDAPSSPPRPSGAPTTSHADAPPRTDWNQVADWYDNLVGDLGSEYHREVVLPGVMRLLAPGPSDVALDVACGQGVLCRLLHERQATVTGIDASGEMIRLAKERSDPAITYDIADARDLSRFDTEKFSIVTCTLAIQNIDPIGPVFDHVASVLAPRGRFVLAMMHPAFRVPKAADWGWDPVAFRQYRRIERYLTTGKLAIRMHPGNDPTQTTWTFHRPLQTYVQALAKAGLMIDALEEWPSHKISDSGPRADAENLARNEIPMFLALRARKA